MTAPVETGLLTTLAVALGLTLLVAVAIYVWYALALSRLFPRLDAEGWKGWVPILNEAEILARGGVPAWSVVFYFIPVVQLYGIYLKVVATHRINKRFGRGAGMTVLAILLPPVWASVLAWGAPPYPESDRLAAIQPGPRRTGQLPAAPARDASGYTIPSLSPPAGERVETAPPAASYPAPAMTAAAPAASLAPAEPDPLEQPPTASVWGAPPPPAAPAPPSAPAAPPSAPAAPPASSEPHQTAVDAPAAVWPAVVPPVPEALAIPTPSAPVTGIMATMNPDASAPAAAPAPSAPPPPSPAESPVVEPAVRPVPPVFGSDAGAAPAPPAQTIAPAPSAPTGDARPVLAPQPPTPTAVEPPPGVDRPAAPEAAAPAGAHAPSATEGPGAAQHVPAAPAASPAPDAPVAPAAHAAPFAPPAPHFAPPAPSGLPDAVDKTVVSPRPTDDDLDATVVVARRRGIQRVLVLDDGRRFALSGASVVLGRNPDGAPGEQRLAISDNTRTLSKTHARLVVDGDEWRLTDLNSTNGVVVVEDDGSETLLDAGETVVGTGRFVLGEVGMQVVAEKVS